MDPDRTRFVFDLKRKLRRSHSEDLLTNATHVGGYSAAAALILFVMHIVLGRMLGPAQYSAYGVYLSILLTVLIAFSSIHLVITRFINYHDTRHQYEQITYIIKKSMKWMFALGFVFFLVTLVFAQSISDFFFIAEATPTVLFGFVVWFTILIPVFEGAFKGLNVYTPLGKMRLIEAVARIIISTFLVYAGFGVAGAIFGLGLGTVIALALSYSHILKGQTKKAIKPNIEHIRRYALPVTLTMVSFALLLNLDILVAKHVFDVTQAGVFTAASIIAKAPVFLALVVIGILYPKVTRLHAHGKSSSQLLQHAVLILSVLMALLTLIFLFFSDFFFSGLFGSAYTIGGILGFYVFAMSAAALALVLITYLLAVSKDSVSFAMPLFVVALAGLLTIFNSSVFQIMIVVMLIMTALCAYAIYMSREVLDFDYFL
jgi:O-antigen/teichoic acid export membrane protein